MILKRIVDSSLQASLIVRNALVVSRRDIGFLLPQCYCVNGDCVSRSSSNIHLQMLLVSRSPEASHPKADRSDFRNQRFETDTGKKRKMQKVPLTPEKQGSDSEEIPKSKNAESAENADTKTRKMRKMRMTGFTVRVKIVTGSLVIIENLLPENYRYRYRLEIRMNYHYRYRLGPRSHPFVSIDAQLPSRKSFELISSKLLLPLPS